MGDMADYFLERAFGPWDDDDGEMREDEYRGIRCRYCGLSRLKWTQTKTGWRLFDSKGMHVCKEYRPQNLKANTIGD